jgi:hypothetical protein
MPFVASDPGPPETLPPSLAPGPSIPELAGASFREGSTVVAAYRALANSGSFAPEPGYSAHDLIMSRPELWEHAYRIAGAQSKAEADAIVGQIDSQNADKALLAAGGPMGYVVGAATGLFDPTVLMPGRVAIRAFLEGRGAVRGAVEMGAAMAAQSTVQESILQATQPGRTLSESAINVASSTVVGTFR